MINLNTKKRIHMIAIKGAGVSGLAQILKGLGHNVSGSDTADTFFTDKILKKTDICVKTPFSVKNIPQNIDLAISSMAYLKSDNIEIKELKKRKIPIFGYANALGSIFNQYYGIAIAGTHGKSTVSAMIAYILEQAGLEPFALIGAELLNWKSNARISKKLQANQQISRPKNIFQIKNKKQDSCFVIEADEYKEQFLNYKPNIIVLTDIDFDHPDYYKNKKAYKNAFKKFIKNIKRNGVIIKNNKLISKNYDLQLIGKHNQRNANLAYLTCKKLGIQDKVIKKALIKFKGTRRRLEKVGKFKNATVIDDYAHHPTEVKASLLALKKEYPNKELVVLFHPHTFSRTKEFLKEFAKSLEIADKIYLLDIYSSSREKHSNITSDDIIKNIKKEAKNLKTILYAIKFFKKNLSSKQVLVTMGAGNVCNVAYSLCSQ
ncbi:MAG: UDP-N-acetylmuramate-L-alanine ligase [Candidatus Roizmanbacteria bacterium GW2011_GWA2_32_13]|uniref:UDP-N-acetylmuramate-L-alanine ligase n=1 Tax=Candidatus Roizmanbacteria bacterium GW2011_GWA2_32_13 TaxID=1618475 RepID=A0A0F9Z078_9BACT|nr:MAG: UDP-N-acetylmuramate-L-alanine ligase [Candidatus Roizmanbacteria bacterium GW2011_GWA2_32_13]